MRIVSLLPSATEIVCALGKEAELVAITHECDYPESIKDRPVITSSILSRLGGENEEPLSAGEIDEKVRQALEAGESLYRIDLDLLRRLEPDVVLTQGLCDVCAVNHKMVSEAASVLPAHTFVLDLAPTTLGSVLETFRQAGKAIRAESEAERLIETTRGRWDRVRDTAAKAGERPRTLLLEWPEPPFSAGHWNPELLQLSGGIGGPWDEIGIPSRTLTWEEIATFAPETLILLACGFDTYRALDEAYALIDAPGWYDLPALRQGECYAVDGNAYFNRPGPRLAESAEILATILHPELFPEMLPPFSAQIFPSVLLDKRKRPRFEDEEETEANPEAI